MLNVTMKVGLVFALLMGASLCVQAAAPGDAHRQVVRYGDLDLDKPAGSQALYQRIVQAAGTVCRDFEGRELAKAARYAKCQSEAIDGAILAINHPLLSGYYIAKHHGKPPQLSQGDRTQHRMIRLVSAGR
jgi:UrcA family protein